MSNKASNDMRQIPQKNYVLFGVLCIVTVVLVFYLSMWYETRQEYYKNNSVMADVLAEININELSNYVLENPDAIIYVASSKDEEIKDFEKKLKDFVLEYNLTNDFVYLDLSQPYNSNVKTVLKNLESENFRTDSFDVSSGVSFVLFENSRVKAIIHRDSSNVKITHIENFMSVYEVTE